MINSSAKWTGTVQYMLHCTRRFFKDPNTFLHMKEGGVLLYERQVECDDVSLANQA